MGSVPAPYNDFRCTHRFCSGVLLTTVYAGNYKVIDSKKVSFLIKVVLPTLTDEYNTPDSPV